MSILVSVFSRWFTMAWIRLNSPFAQKFLTATDALFLLIRAISGMAWTALSTLSFLHDSARLAVMFFISFGFVSEI